VKGKKMTDLNEINLNPNPEWVIREAGILIWQGTKYEIRHEICSLNLEWLTVYYNGRAISRDANLESCKYTARRHMQKLLEMGLEP
jgi:hypothetical protein